VAGYTPAAVGDSAEWTATVSAAEENRTKFCKALSGKTLFSALYGTYTVTFNSVKYILKASNSAGKTTEKPTQEEGFQEVRRRKRQHSTTETAPTSKKSMPAAASAAVYTPQKEVAPFILHLLPKIGETHEGGDMPLTSQHSCQRYF
jgi:hypothetical protein